ncbi:hypothetical protein CQZ94_27525 [Bacillus sp. MYb209]|uniref:hypothetical protein n=1 Tax=Bacillus sp. MYb209 TaxID=1848605 RepID=UPI000CFD922D|nr:hypothetical protein [Bacillus sp. MYb209]PQZ48642.1 hypothetical protein CQZ94_27525 [Bacillus sp. MYb209]
MIKLHNVHSLHSIDWDSKKDGAYVRDSFLPLFQKGVTAFIENVNTQLFLLEIDDLILPVTINNAEFENSYVCSPYTHYISYALEELWELKKPWLEKLLTYPIHLMGSWLRRTNINKVIVVNNWMLSTNLYHSINKQQIEQITNLFVEKFPEHTILFRSLNNELYPTITQALSTVGYNKIMSRSIYLFDPKHYKEMNRKKRKDLLNDKSLLEKSNYEIITNEGFTKEDILQISELYNQLYIEKYSVHNPMFTPAYLWNALQHHLFEIKAIKKGDTIDGVIAYFIRDGVMTTPILGYNTNSDQHQCLYRILSLLITMDSIEKDLICHRSAGAGEFKRNRGAKQQIEYSYMYHSHLPPNQQKVWKVLTWILNTCIEPMAKKHRF